MDIKFNWKNFEYIKPEIGTLCVLNSRKTISDSPYVITLAKYLGTQEKLCDGKMKLVHIFTECKEVNYKKFKIVNKNYHIPIYPKECFCGGFNPYNFEWDSYCDNWL